MNRLFKLVFFVPDAYLESVKNAVFAAGAGRQGNYEQCCWQTLGTGQFRPLPGAQPAIGHVGDLEKLAEWRVEMILEKVVVKQVISKLLAAHPYEEVAFDLVELTDPSAL